MSALMMGTEKAEDRAQLEDGAMTGGAAGGLGSEKR